MSYEYQTDTIEYKLQVAILAAFQESSLEISLGDINIDRISDKSKGDYTSTIVLRSAKKFGQSPASLGEIIKSSVVKHLDALVVSHVDFISPGFINFTISSNTFFDQLVSIGDDYGHTDLGKGKTVMIEFGQPNTHKAITIGHMRSLVSGLSLVKLYENLGYEVVRANYFGDVGMQVAKCTWAVKTNGFPEGFEGMDLAIKMKYVNEQYIYGSKMFKDDTGAEEQIRQINKKIYLKQSDDPDVKLYKKLRDLSVAYQDELFRRFGVVYDRQYPESEICDEAVDIVKANIGKLFTQDADGSVFFDGKAHDLTNWVFLTKEGVPTYSAKDMALAKKKFDEYTLDLSIVTTSLEQRDYFKAVIKCVETLYPQTEGRYKHIAFGWMLMNNKKMSSRGGAIGCVEIVNSAIEQAKAKITEIKRYSEAEKDAIAEVVAFGGLKFMILSHEYHKDINYNPDNFILLDGFSGPYIMYSYARACSILKNFDTKPAASDCIDKVKLSEDEVDIIKKIALLPETAKNAALRFAPNIVATYVYDVAVAFNNFYTKFPVVKEEDPELRFIRYEIVRASSIVLKNALNLLGIDVVEKM